LALAKAVERKLTRIHGLAAVPRQKFAAAERVALRELTRNLASLLSPSEPRTARTTPYPVTSLIAWR
jgi:hypothetical protein